MCNLYSLTKSQDAIRRITKAMRDRTGNLPSLPGIFPDRLAPVVRMTQGERECKCGSALKHAIFTAPNLWPEATTKKLEAIIKKYQA